MRRGCEKELNWPRVCCDGLPVAASAASVAPVPGTCTLNWLSAGLSTTTTTNIRATLSRGPTQSLLFIIRQGHWHGAILLIYY
jgi:hypothetical protein